MMAKEFKVVQDEDDWGRGLGSARFERLEEKSQMLSKGPEHALSSGNNVFQFQLDGDLTERQFVICLQGQVVHVVGLSSLLTASLHTHSGFFCAKMMQSEQCM